MASINNKNKNNKRDTADRFFKHFCPDGFHKPLKNLNADMYQMIDRNFALAYFMKENKCFPKGFNLQVFDEKKLGYFWFF